MKKLIILSMAAFLLSSFMMVGSAFANDPSGPVSNNMIQTHHKKWHKKHRRHHKRHHKIHFTKKHG